MESERKGLIEQLASMTSIRDVLAAEKLTLESQTNSSYEDLTELREKLTQTTSELTATARQLQTAQAELKAAIRRADDAENTQKDLQAEGTSLMRSLDEMRPKIVELTGVKLDLGEKVERFERTLRNRDATIAQLESTVDELRDRNDEADREWQEKFAAHQKEYALAASQSSDLQKAYTDLQEELETSLASLRNLEAERSNHHQEALRRLEEIESLNKSSRTQSEELEALRQELDERRQEQVGVEAVA